MLRSPLLDAAHFAHGFSTRLGGVSLAPFDSLNLQSRQANARVAQGAPRDTDTALATNLARLLSAARIESDRPVADVSQVHGCTVVAAHEALHARGEADAITSVAGGAAVMVRVADCVPLLLACPKSGAVAAVHAGWRGVVAGVVPAALVAMHKLGADGRTLLVAIGPCISGASFEIGDEVARVLVDADLAACVIQPGVHGPKHHADLVAAVTLQLMRCGVSRDHIDDDAPCTYRDAQRFFSFRRDGTHSGRLAAIIAPRA